MKKFFVEEMVLEITRACTLDCSHCFRGEAQNSFMDAKTIDNALKEIIQIDNFTLSGGEPFLAVSQINSVADAIEKYKIKVNRLTIITNGTVLNKNVITSLARLSSVCPSLNIKVSDDKFHLMALERKGLLNRRNVNFVVLNDLFGALKYGTARKDGRFSIIECVGRAANLTKEDMDEVNNFGEYHTNYILSKSNLYDGIDMTIHYDRPSYAGNMCIKNMINIDVNGYLTDSYASYEDADSHNIDSCNINNVSLLEAVRNNAERVMMTSKKGL